MRGGKRRHAGIALKEQEEEKANPLISDLFLFLRPFSLYGRDGTDVVRGATPFCLCLRLLRLAAVSGLSIIPHFKYLEILRFKEFGVDGGPSSKALNPKFDLLRDHMASLSFLHIPQIDVKYLIAPVIAFKGFGSLLFILGSSYGAYLLLLHQGIVALLSCNFCNYNMKSLEFKKLLVRFIEELALCGALLFYLGMKKSILKRQQHKANKRKNSKPKIH